ncbi:hypothetical protein AVEN_207850-1 [Araneus ventricosus]|uniref:Uncharacterized protein n=1 Tax=Araneus ventricosus TaxID=182803 RepID=A0A4Y2R1X9_ARAVE|nr:hypothetical protein AVEN_207850-1 [Araneus ventricosus]
MDMQSKWSDGYTVQMEGWTYSPNRGMDIQSNWRDGYAGQMEVGIQPSSPHHDNFESLLTLTVGFSLEQSGMTSLRTFTRGCFHRLCTFRIGK